MKTDSFPSFWSCLSLGVLLLAAATTCGQSFIPYFDGHFDIQIAFGCNCTCFCDTNNMDTNNPINMFLIANPPKYIYAHSGMPQPSQVVPPHWTELLASCTFPDFGGPDNYILSPVGWTVTQGPLNPNPDFTTPWIPLSFTLNQPIDFNTLKYGFYAHALPKYANAGAPAGEPGTLPTVSQTTCQPYPWEVNVTMQLQNGQFYYMEQQLVVGLYPLIGPDADDNPPGTPVIVETPVNYMETNSLLDFSLYCTNGGVTNLLSSDITYTISAYLLTNNLPTTNDENIGWPSPNVFTLTNWTWPFTPMNMAETPLSSHPNPSIPNDAGAVDTLQAQLSQQHTTTIDNQPLLVRANRAYKLELKYWLNGQYIETLTNYTTNYISVVPSCTNLQIAFYTVNCTNVPETNNTECYSTNTGVVDMLGAPNVWPNLPLGSTNSGITVSANSPWYKLGYAADPNYENLPGSPPVLTPLPANFLFHVLLVNLEGVDVPYDKWATENLGTNTAYEYFSSPVFRVTNEACSAIVDLSNIFVMCPSNPAVVQGTVTLNGCVNSNYYGGTNALSFLQFADYNNAMNPGLPYDPDGTPDPTLANVSSIIATNGHSAPGAPVFSSGGGRAVSEFDNPGGFFGPNNFTGNYSLKLAGLESGESYWDANDLHLVFGSPVSLDYDIHEMVSNLDISCGRVLTRNINHCFGLVTLVVTNTYPPPIPDGSKAFGYLDDIDTHVDLHISGVASDNSYTVGPFTVPNFPFQYQTSARNEADVQLFLPEGQYQWSATVYYPGGYGNLGVTNYFTVNCCTNSPCNCVPPPTNMVLWLPFDEPPGYNSKYTANIAPVPDANNGLKVGSPSVNLGAYVDNSLQFANSQYVIVSNYPAINPGTNQGFTLDAWVNRGAATSNDYYNVNVILEKEDFTTGDGYSLYLYDSNSTPAYDGELWLRLSRNHYNTGTEGVPADGQWHFIAVTVSGGSPRTGEFYIDADAPVAFTPANVNLASTTPLFVGDDSVLHTHSWQGGLDEVEMYDRALSQSEIEAIFNAGPCGKCKPVITNTPCLQVQCPSNIVVYSAACTNDVLVGYPQPIVTDLCCSNPTVTFDPPNASYFAPGTTTPVTCTVSDDCGNTNTCTFMVRVICGLPNVGGVRPDIAAPNGTPVIFWPASATNYVLQTTTNLSSPNWVTVTNGTPITGLSLTNNNASVQFYRLYNPNP